MSEPKWISLKIKIDVIRRKKFLVPLLIPMLVKVTKLIEKCPICGDDTVGNGSKFYIEEDTFERTCRNCGWRITGRAEGNKLIVTSDNKEEL